jgi:comEA protein
MLSYFRKFGFTKRDLILIGSLIAAMLAGLIIKWSGWRDSIKQFDYSSSDSLFEKNLTAEFSRHELSDENKLKLKKLQLLEDNLQNKKDSAEEIKVLSDIGEKINLNTASSDDLELLPGIGESTAEKIIEYRQTSGGFKEIEQLMNVKGIGAKKFSKLKNLIFVDTLKFKD